MCEMSSVDRIAAVIHPDVVAKNETKIDHLQPKIPKNKSQEEIEVNSDDSDYGLFTCIVAAVW